MKQPMRENSGVTSNIGIISVKGEPVIGSDSVYTPCTCLSHIKRGVDYAIPDENAGLVAKLHCAFLNYLRKNAD